MAKRKKKGFRFPFGLLFLLLLLAIPLLMLGSLSSISEDLPLVGETQRMNTDAAVRAKTKLSDLRKKLKSEAQTETIVLSEKDLNGMVAVAARAIHRLHGEANVTPVEAQLRFTLDLPENPFGRFINIRAGVVPSDYGLHLAPVYVGQTEIPGPLALKLVETLLQAMMKDEQSSAILQAIQSVDIQGDRVTAVFQPLPNLKQWLKPTFRQVAQQRAGVSPERLRFYFAKLCELDQLYPHAIDTSATAYIAPLFEIANKRTAAGASAVKENRAALQALGIFLGSPRFERALGHYRTGELAECRERSKNVVLAGRHDMVQHVFISSTMQMLGDSEISFAIGEFKEIYDTRGKDYGLSFSDIAANRAGVRLAEQLLNPASAARAQAVLARAEQEAAFFLKVSDLPDEMPQREFERRFGSVDDPRYHAMLKKIDERLDRLPAFQ